MIPFSEHTPVIDSISNLEHVEQSLNSTSNSNLLAGIFNSFATSTKQSKYPCPYSPPLS